MRRQIACILFGLSCLMLFCPGCRSALPEYSGRSQHNGEPLPQIVVADKDPVPMVLIPAGTFFMGSQEGDDDEGPVHKVFINAFYMDVAEVTCARYARFLEETGYPPHPMWDPQHDRPGDPVAGVSWRDARAFAEWTGKRLPTEAEWERAAGGGATEGAYPWGDAIDREKANYNSFGTTPVKSYAPNSFGLYDMAGNVWEWCQDWYDGTYYGVSPTDNPKGPLYGLRKVVRGGAWYCNEDALRITNRHKHDPDLGSFHIGFRCVVSAAGIKK